MKTTELLSIAAIVVVCEFTATAQDSAANYQPKTFEQLSERTVSRMGDQALKMKSVKWQHGESDHFIFHAEAGFSIPQLAGATEGYYESIKRDLDIRQDTYQRKSHIYVFESEEAWREFARTTKLDAWTGGVCTGRELFFQARTHFKFQGNTLPHELTHLTLYRFVGGDIPLWLNEGFAEFEATRLYRAYLKARNYQLKGLSARLPKEQFIPLARLTSAIDYPARDEEVKAFYTQSERLVSFLYYNCGGITPLMKFIKVQSQGLTFEAACRDVYADIGKWTDANRFENRFITFATTEEE